MLRPKHIPAPGALRLALVLGGVVVGALGLAGCGVKGPLEPPPGAQATGPTISAQEATAATSSSPGRAKDASSEWKSGGGHKGESSGNLLQGAQKPNQPFILDGLL